MFLLKINILTFFPRTNGCHGNSTEFIRGNILHFHHHHHLTAVETADTTPRHRALSAIAWASSLSIRPVSLAKVSG